MLDKGKKPIAREEKERVNLLRRLSDCKVSQENITIDNSKGPQKPCSTTFEDLRFVSCLSEHSIVICRIVRGATDYSKYFYQ